MYDLTACGVFYKAGPTEAHGWQPRCYDHEAVWAGPTRPDTKAGFTRAQGDADRHYRSEHPDV